MRNLAFALLAGTLALASCSQKSENGYNLNGKIAGNTTAFDGKKVYLEHLDTIKFRTVKTDTAIIKNGAFAFVGDIQNAQMARINLQSVLPYSGSHHDQNMVVLEKGNIALTIDSQKTKRVWVSGTPLNAAYATYDSLAAKAGDELAALPITSAFAVKQIKNNAGKYVFARNTSFFDVAQLGNILAAVDAKDAQLPFVKQAAKRLKALKATAVGQTYTNLNGVTPKNKKISLSDYVGKKKNKYVLLDFWASWCPDCRREMPTVVDAYKKYKGKGLEIVGVSLDSNTDAWQKGIEKLGVKWPQMSDLKSWNSVLSSSYGVHYIPQMVLIDHAGKIVSRSLSGDNLDAEMAKLLMKKK